MNEIKTTDQKFLNIETKMGIFISLAILGFIAIWFFIGKQKDMFSQKSNIYFITESAKNINQGANVTFSGFKIGKVSSVDLNNDDKVLVKLSINTSYINRLKKDSQAILTKELPIGQSVIEIMPGSKDSKQIGGNGFITFVKKPWFPAMSDEINTIPISFSKNPEMQALIKTLKNAFDNDFRPMMEDLKVTLKNFRKVSEDAQVTRQYLDNMYRNADNNLNALDLLIENLNDEIPLMIDKAHESLDSIKFMADDIRSVTIDAFDQITQVINQGSKLTNEAEIITEAVKQVWPISSKIKKMEKQKAKEAQKKIKEQELKEEDVIKTGPNN